MWNTLYAKVASLKCTRLQWVASGGFEVMQWMRVQRCMSAVLEGLMLACDTTLNQLFVSNMEHILRLACQLYTTMKNNHYLQSTPTTMPRHKKLTL